ncbi:MAG: glycerate kinase [Clostridia bacterium]|nr:glycerate kinase [Clostridia bacterium]
MNILVACDSFKGSLSSAEVCGTISEILNKADIDTIVCPLADGGEGTVDAFRNALKCEVKTVTVHDPLMREISAQYAISENTAIIEMAAASGITLLKENELNPEITSTYGTGELILHAIESGCTKIIIGIGGSATNDGGKGCLEALGAVFTDKNGTPLNPGGASLKELESIDLTGFKRASDYAELIIACDVTSPLFGENGATKVFARQKGADNRQIEKLENALIHFSEKSKEVLYEDYSTLSGTGAAGGLGFALVAYCGGKLTSGFDAVSNALSLEEKIKDCDLVITGEGKTDNSTLSGKLPIGVARLTKKHNKPCILLSGDIEAAVDLSDYFYKACKCRLPSDSTEDAIKNAKLRLISATENLLKDLKF